MNRLLEGIALAYECRLVDGIEERDRAVCRRAGIPGLDAELRQAFICAYAGEHMRRTRRAA